MLIFWWGSTVRRGSWSPHSLKVIYPFILLYILQCYLVRYGSRQSLDPYSFLSGIQLSLLGSYSDPNNFISFFIASRIRINSFWIRFSFSQGSDSDLVNLNPDPIFFQIFRCCTRRWLRVGPCLDLSHCQVQPIILDFAVHLCHII